ncbi:MAG: hypothetical protein R2867_19695 [Caldilineaceae bacterium]
MTVIARQRLFAEEAAQPALRQDGRRLLYPKLAGGYGRAQRLWDPGGDLLLRCHLCRGYIAQLESTETCVLSSSNNEGDRIWRIYLTWAESGSETTVLSIGEAPAWHPSSDVIVFRGCDHTAQPLWSLADQQPGRRPWTADRCAQRQPVKPGRPMAGILSFKATAAAAALTSIGWMWRAGKLLR